MASIATGLTVLGCILLSLSLRRHYRQLFADESTYARRLWPLRIAGYTLVAFALWPCMLAFGAPIGLCLWLSILALAAFAQIMLLTYQPRGVTVFGALGAVLVVVGLLP